MVRFFSQSSDSNSSNSSFGQSSDDNSSDSSSEHSYDATESLFEQLEEGARWYTNIEGTIKDGANLYAKKLDGDFKGDYPIHIAAKNLLGNTAIFGTILRTFSNPDERKRYILLKNDKNYNAIEIILQNDFEGIVTKAIVTILSYLTPDEQRDTISSLNDSAKERLACMQTSVSCAEELRTDASLDDWLCRGTLIEMCKQRRDEEQKIYEGCDSDDESLGKLDAVYNKKFTAKVYYQESIHEGIISVQPELILIPSDWRLETSLSTQGDHVTAYVLLLSSFSHCKGENIKKIPQLIHDLSIRVLPDFNVTFNTKKTKLDEKLGTLRTQRVTAISALKAHTTIADIEISSIEARLKKSEIEAISNYLEDVVDFFIKTVNKLADESFSHERKISLTKKHTLEKLSSIIQRSSILSSDKYCDFKSQLIQAIDNESTIKPDGNQVTDECLKKIIKEFKKTELNKSQIPPILLSSTGTMSNITLLSFLKENTPFKKYHEGYVIKDMKEDLTLLEEDITNEEREELILRIGFHCFKLFDYPRVNEPEKNNISTLCEAIPRHWIIINAAFSDFQKCSLDERNAIYDAFLNHILVLQDWETFLIQSHCGKTVTLDIIKLKQSVLDCAQLDDNNNFVMNGKEDNPLMTNCSYTG